MRKDFGKVVIERPRSGSRNRSAKVRQFGKIVRDEDGELEYLGYSKIPMSMNGRAYGWDSKYFTDVLGPIYGFLLSRVGQPFDKVWSEMKAVLGKAPWPVQHILKDHVDVYRTVYIGYDGRLWSHDRFGPFPLEDSYRHRHRAFYVEPGTGILRVVPKRKYQKEPEVKDPIYDLNNGKFLVRLKGIWYLGHYERFTEKPLLGTKFPDNELSYFVKDKQASKKELKGIPR